MPTGTIIRVHADKGYAFIERDGALPDVFVHATGLTGSLYFGEHLLGERVTFSIATDDRTGRDKAVNVRPETS